MQTILAERFHEIESALLAISTPEKAKSAQRYFPHDLDCYGANAKDIQGVVKTFQKKHSIVTANETLKLSEYILSRRPKHEMKLVAFALVEKFVRKHYDDTLLETFKYWLEAYADNWAQVDDLCLKAIYKFLLARPYLIENTNDWALSSGPWCKRASNVVWVKFVYRKIGSDIYQLNTRLIFHNCQLLLEDKDEYVQKSIGWLLKATSVYHQSDVESFLIKHHHKITRETLRYAIEKMSKEKRKAILAFP